MSQEWVSYRRSARMPVEVMRAHFEHHRYDLHAALASALRGVHDALVGGESALAQDEALHSAVRAMVRLGAVTAAPPGWAPETRREDEGLRQVRELLHEHFAEDIGTARLTEISGRSRFALYRAFRDLHGLTPGEYQRQLRVRHARRLLESGSSPAQAAVESGFADQSHLTRWFRRYYALTPARFRDAARDQAWAS